MTVTAPLPRKRLRVAFLLADQFTLSAFANFVDVLRLAADEADKSRPILCDWTVLSDSMDAIRSSCGVRVQPDTRLRHAGAFDYLVVVGGLISDRSVLSNEMLGFIRGAAESGIPVVGLCTGVFILQRAGLLKGYRCCVSWFHHQDFLDRFDSEMPVSDQIFVVDRDRLTCSGGHGAAHLAAFLVQRHIGQSAAIKSLNIMMIEDALSGERAQPGQLLERKANDELVKRAVLRMQQNIEMPKSIQELARELGVARRTLERRFLADLKKSPLKIYLDLRIERALQRLRHSDSPITEIALACGFCDAPHFARMLKAERGVTPAEYRKAQASHHEDQPAVGVLIPQQDGAALTDKEDTPFET
ncbi:GlxA family transcriptional regulator [Paracoccus saliphilus]|uniref:GlxA family transcriptional regulator n=1 Tax=Paracoccus saliphilus TaxID=405559 RepID=A0AA45W8G3_9RHOB|nr:GlxA family transcriptional regulator [Paracoccus saliphilus]WCR02084.1 GlxA family transcriptional regulator [Paracoccus saliphilus]SIT16705.1 transcriptional regulator, AraC family with amidase-like domain [Paracoccus saliphilus]